MVSHNLNTEVKIAGPSIVVPKTVLLNEANVVEGFGSVHNVGIGCARMESVFPSDCEFRNLRADKRGRPPNFLLWILTTLAL